MVGFVEKNSEIIVLFNDDVVKYWLVKLFGVVVLFNLLVGEFFSFCGCFIRVFFDV